MFELLLEKLLLKYLGRFIDGIDTNNLHLGVFSGNIVIENVCLKKNILEMLGLPMDVIFSDIKKLQIIVPWHSLSSQPVEVFIHNIVFLIKKKNREQWDFPENTVIQNRLYDLINYSKTLINNYQKQNTVQQEKGYIEKMTLKIIDNIQLTIKDIHIRFEEDNVYSAGVFLKEITAFTTNSNWEKKFIDRTVPANKDCPVNKVIKIVDLFFYWQQKEKEENFLSKIQQASILKEKMTNYIKCNEINKIISISSEIKFINNTILLENTSRYEMIIHLQNLEFKMIDIQLKQFMIQFDDIRLYSIKMKYLKKSKLESGDLNENYKKQFFIIQKKILKIEENQPNQGFISLDNDEQDQIKNILIATPTETLQEWVQQMTKESVRELKMEELEKKKNKRYLYFFGKDEEITEQEIQDIERLVQAQEEVTMDFEREKKDASKFMIIFKLDKGSFSLQQQNTLQDIKVQYNQIQFSFKQQFNGNQQIKLDVQYININVNHEVNTQNMKLYDFLRIKNPEKKYLEISYKKILKDSINKVFQTQIQLQLEAAIWQFDSNFIQIVQEFLVKSYVNKNDKYQQQIKQMQIQQVVFKPYSTDFDINVNNQDLEILYGQEKAGDDILKIQFGKIVTFSISQANQLKIILQDFGIEFYYYHQKSKEKQILSVFSERRNFNVDIAFPQRQDQFVQISFQFQDLIVQLNNYIIKRIKNLKQLFQRKEIQKQKIEKQQKQMIKTPKNQQLEILFNSFQFYIYKDQDNQYKQLPLINISLNKLRIDNKNFLDGKVMTQIQFQKFSFIDGFFNFNNKQFQPFIVAQDDILWKIEIIKNINQKFINVYLPEIMVNFKPDTYIQILNLISVIKTGSPLEIKMDFINKTWEQSIQELFENTEYKNSVYINKQNQHISVKGKHRQKYTTYLGAQQSGLVESCHSHIYLKINQINMVMIHRQTHCGIFSLTVKQLVSNVFQTKNALFVDGQIDDVNLSDLTNYPKSFDNNQILDTIIPYTMISKKSDSKQKIQFSFTKFNQDFFPNKEKIDKFLTIEGGDIEIVYQQQIMMRIIDYLMNQLIFLLVKAENAFLNDNHDYSSSNLPIQVYENNMFDVVKKFFDPLFFDMMFVFNNAHLLFKPWPWMTEYIRIVVPLITVYNLQKQETFRFLNEQKKSTYKYFDKMWCENWIVQADNAKLQYFNSQQYFDLSTEFKFNLNFGRLMWFPDLNLIFPEETKNVDRGMWIHSSISQLVLKLTREEYLNVVKGIIHNFTYDDNMDERFSHNFKLNKLFTPGTINFYLDFPKLFFYGMRIFNKQPFYGIMGEDLRFKFFRDSQFFKIIGVYVNKANISYYTYLDSFANIIPESDGDLDGQCKEVIEQCMIGDITQQKVYQFSNKLKNPNFFIDQCFIDGKETSINQRNQFTTYKFADYYNEKKTQVYYESYMDPITGNKNMELGLQDLYVYAKTSVVVNLLQWSLLDQSCWVVVPWYGDLNRIFFQVNVRNSSLILPNLNIEQKLLNKEKVINEYVLCTEGEISYVLLKQKRPADENLQEMFINGQINNDFLADMGDIFAHNVTTSNLDIFICSFDDVRGSLKGLGGIKRRSLIKPLSLYYSLKFELGIHRCVVKEGDKEEVVYPPYYRPKHDLSLEQFIITMTYPDIKLLQQIGDMQGAEFGQVRGEPKTAANTEHNRMKDRGKDQCPQQNIFDCIIYGLSFFFLNDAKSGCYPVLDFHLTETQIVYNKIQVKSILSTLLTLQAQFYNMRTSKWEPIIEKTSIGIDLQTYEDSNPKKQLIIEINPLYEQINLSISTDMFEVLWETIQNLLNQIKAQNQRVNGSSSIQSSHLESQSHVQGMQMSKDSIYQETSSLRQIEYGSPYIIFNEIGYDIEIESQQKKGHKQLIQAYSQFNYKVELDYEGLSERQEGNKNENIIIIDLLHPLLGTFQNKLTVDLDQIGKRQYRMNTISKNNSIQKANYSYGNKSIFVKKIDDSQPQDKQSFTIIIETIPKNQKKILLIRSSFKIINSLDQNIEIKLTGQQVHQHLKSHQALYLPFDKLNSYIQFKIDDQQYGYSNQHSKMGHSDINPSLVHNDYEGWTLEQNLQKLDKGTPQIDLGNNCYSLLNYSIVNEDQHLNIQPTASIKNCLPISIQVQLFVQNKTHYRTIFREIFDVQQEIQLINFNIDDQIFIEIKVPNFHITNKHLFNDPNVEKITTQTIKLVDYYKFENNIEIQNCDSSGSKRFLIFASDYVINDTNQDLTFSYANKVRHSFEVYGGHASSLNEEEKDIEQSNSISAKKICLLGPYEFLKIAQKNYPEAVSNHISRAGVGRNTFTIKGNVLDTNMQQMYQYGVKFGVECVDKEHNLIQKWVIISPKYIIVNHTKGFLSVAQKGVLNASQIVVQPQQRVPLYWYDQAKSQTINIQLEENYIKYENLGGIDLVSKNNSFIVRNMIKKTEIKFMFMELREDDHITYLIFSETQSENEAMYVVENKLTNATISIHQLALGIDSTNIQEYPLHIPEQSNHLFAWDFPNLEKKIVVDIKIDQKCGTFKNTTIEPWDLTQEKLEHVYEFEQLVGPDSFKFSILIQSEGVTKKIKFQHNEQASDSNLKDQMIEFQTRIQLKKVGISFIGFIEGMRKEIGFLTINNLESVILETSAQKTIQLKIGYINLDNNISYSTDFPVILTPTKSRKLTKLNRPQFSLVIDQNIQVKNAKVFQSIRCALQPTTIKLTDTYLQVIKNYVEQIVSIFKSSIDINKKVEEKSFLYEIDNNEPESNEVEKKKEFLWEDALLYDAKEITFINEIKIYPINLDLSFKSTPQKNAEVIKNIVQALSLSFTNIDNAPLSLSKIHLEQQYDTVQGIIKNLVIHYRDEVMKSILKVLGSMSLFGSPVVVIKYIMKGCIDLVDKPMTGFVKGPIEGGIGIAQGVGSLVSNSFAGVFSLMESFASAMANGTSSISMDSRYLNQRQQIKTREKTNVMTGIGNAVLALFNGFEKGITGIVLQPYRGAINSGVKGFGKGIVKGAIGFVFKPVSGAFDFVAFTSEGIKNQVQMFRDKPNNTRIRPPRVFYDEEQYYKSYKKYHSEIVQYLSIKDQGKNSPQQFLDAVYFKIGQESHILIIGLDLIVLLKNSNRKVIWDLKASYIQNVNIDGDNLWINVYDKDKSGNIMNRKLEIQKKYAKARDYIIEKINYVVEKKMLQ